MNLHKLETVAILLAFGMCCMMIATCWENFHV